MPLREQDLRARLEAFFEQLDEPAVQSAYLFGSHSDGRAHRESDIDVGVLVNRSQLPCPEDRYELRVRLGSELIAALHHNEIDVVLLDDCPPLLGRAVITRGIKVYCRDAQADHAYVRDIQLRAADLEPFLLRMAKIKLESLAS